MKKYTLAALCLFISQGAMAQDLTESQKNLSAFPAESADQVRYVIHLPALENEEDAKVEIIAGRDVKVDCNKHWFGGELKSNTVEGWGFSYYTLDASDQMMGTKMACLDQETKEEFVPVIGQNFTMRYNSRLPIVIYADDAFKINYRIWKPSDTIEEAQRG